MEAKDTMMKVLKDANKYANELASVTEGDFSQEDIDGIYEGAYLAIYQAGIREVVEWLSGCMLIEHCDTNGEEVFCRDYRVYSSEWQAKLKSWNIGK